MIVKIKHNGCKSKFRILSDNERITANCYYQYADHFDPRTKLFPAESGVGDLVSEHPRRIYLEKLTNIIRRDLC